MPLLKQGSEEQAVKLHIPSGFSNSTTAISPPVKPVIVSLNNRKNHWDVFIGAGLLASAFRRLTLATPDLNYTYSPDTIVIPDLLYTYPPPTQYTPDLHYTYRPTTPVSPDLHHTYPLLP